MSIIPCFIVQYNYYAVISHRVWRGAVDEDHHMGGDLYLELSDVGFDLTSSLGNLPTAGSEMKPRLKTEDMVICCQQSCLAYYETCMISPMIEPGKSPIAV
jgi:hypothetical protein